MSDVFEVAFSGKIAEGADLQQVKANVARMFKADDAKLAQLFSGKRIVIKKNIDQQTALKYQTALQKAGALCELVNLSAAPAEVEEVQAAPPPVPQAATGQSSPAPAVTASAYTDRDVPPAPQTVPLSVTGDQIADLGASLAPVGSDLHDHTEEDVAPPVVPQGLSMAPVGTDLGEPDDKPAPPPPDTSGLSMQDN